MSDYATDGSGTIHISNLAKLPTRAWTFHPADGTASRAMAILGEKTVPAYCVQQEVLATDALPAASPELTRPAVGIATHGAMTVLPIEDVAAQPDDASRIVARLVREMTEALETDRAAQTPSRLAAISPADRRQAPVVIMRLDRVRGEREDSYYFEAHKAYGYTHAYARGWIRSSRFRLSLFQVSAGVDSGGESSRATGHPVGALPGPVWIMETQGYEGSSYDLVVVADEGQVISVSGGGC